MLAVSSDKQVSQPLACRAIVATASSSPHSTVFANARMRLLNCTPCLRLHCCSEEKDLRITKLPAGVSSIMVEPGPNPTNDNSAVWVNYQV